MPVKKRLKALEIVLKQDTLFLLIVKESGLVGLIFLFSTVLMMSHDFFKSFLLSLISFCKCSLSALRSKEVKLFLYVLYIST